MRTSLRCLGSGYDRATAVGALVPRALFHIDRLHGRMAATSDRGATSVEYALMASLIAVVIVGAVTIFGTNVEGLFIVPAGAL